MARLPQKRQSVTSTLYFRVPVTVKKSGVAYDPTGDVVRMAFLKPGIDPDDTTYRTGDWEPDGAKHWARVLVGPASGGLQLAKGSYVAWLRIGDDPEIPSERVAQLIIT